ncbi:MAG: McrC family protein [Campylobacteraceae bacterium]|jgi:5-methylcytosine-specific restriction enzyme subunit McrC|nr:McrC family protein [Campylobacteraceae bacterium]
MKNPIIIKEYDFLHCKEDKSENYIKEKTFNAIKKFVLKNSESAQYLKPCWKKGFGEVLQAQNYVGIIQTKDGTTIEILPKIADISDDENCNETKKILIKMLKTLKNSPFKNLDTANLKTNKMPLLEIFITMFLEELSKLIRQGLRSDYIGREENLKYLKGKLDINEHIKRNYVHKERFFVKYQEFLSDRVENRLIKTTLEFLYKMSHSTANQQHIREFLFVFDDISLCGDVKTAFTNIKINRQLAHYEQTLLWCKTFLLHDSFTPYSGDDVAFALLFDMNKLFESYVGHYLRQKPLSVKLQDKTHFLAYQNSSGKFRLQPDIVITRENKPTIIADTKWKILGENDYVNQADMYQLYAYGTKYENCKRLYLIYPKSDVKSVTYSYREDLNLTTLFFDLRTSSFVDEETIDFLR